MFILVAYIKVLFTLNCKSVLLVIFIKNVIFGNNIVIFHKIQNIDAILIPSFAACKSQYEV